jgi:hypothetical protein
MESGSAPWTPAWSRPYRREPRLAVIVRYWHERGDPFPLDDDDLSSPHCFGCCRLVPARLYDPADAQAVRWDKSSACLDRAHLVDRCRGGLDGPQNLVPLCLRCHRVMPMFTDGMAAISWVMLGGYRPLAGTND